MMTNVFDELYGRAMFWCNTVANVHGHERARGFPLEVVEYVSRSIHPVILDSSLEDGFRRETVQWILDLVDMNISGPVGDPIFFHDVCMVKYALAMMCHRWIQYRIGGVENRCDAICRPCHRDTCEGCKVAELWIH